MKASVKKILSRIVTITNNKKNGERDSRKREGREIRVAVEIDVVRVAETERETGRGAGRVVKGKGRGEVYNGRVSHYRCWLYRTVQCSAS